MIHFAWVAILALSVIMFTMVALAYLIAGDHVRSIFSVKIYPFLMATLLAIIQANELMEALQ